MATSKLLLPATLEVLWENLPTRTLLSDCIKFTFAHIQNSTIYPQRAFCWVLFSLISSSLINIKKWKRNFMDKAKSLLQRRRARNGYKNLLFFSQPHLSSSRINPSSSSSLSLSLFTPSFFIDFQPIIITSQFPFSLPSIFSFFLRKVREKHILLLLWKKKLFL